MSSSHDTLRVLSVLLLGLRAGPRDWPLTDTEERPSRARRGLHPSKMEVRVAGAVWTRRQTTDPHNSSHNQPSLGSPPPSSLEPVGSEAAAQHSSWRPSGALSWPKGSTSAL